MCWFNCDWDYIVFTIEGDHIVDLISHNDRLTKLLILMYVLELRHVGYVVPRAYFLRLIAQLKFDVLYKLRIWLIQ
jgi:hypothetical protein